MRGLVRLEVIKHLKGKKERKTQVGHNMISNGGLSAIAAKGIEDFLGGSSYFGGRTTLKTTMMFKLAGGSSYTSTGIRADNNRKCLSCALLGLSSATYANIDSRRGFLPLMDNTGAVGTDSVRAIANIKSIATNTNGISKAMNGSSLIDISRNGRKYDFPGGTGDGDVTGVAMIAASAAVPGSVPWGGMRVCRRIDDFSGFEDKITGCTKIVPPGIDGNGASVRMLFTTADGVTVHNRNLITGAQTDGTGTEWFCPREGKFIPVYDDGSYIYAIPRDNSNGYMLSYRYDKSNSYNAESKLVYLGYSSGNTAIYGSIYNNGTGVDAWAIPNNRSSYVAVMQNWANNTSQQFSNKSDLAAWLSTNYGITVPSAMISDSNIASFIPGTVGSNKALYVLRSQNSTYEIEAWIFSNGASVVSSLVDIIQCLSTGSVLWAYGTYYGVLELGRYDQGGAYQGGYKLAYGQYSSTGYFTYAMDNDFTPGNDDYSYGVFSLDSTEGYIENYQNGCYISMQGQWTNWMSVKALEETVTKSSETEILVEYDYAFEGSGTTPVTPISGS